MSKRKRVWIAVALVGVLSAAGLLLTMFRTSKLVFTESDIQARLNQHLPKTFKEVTIERVAVRLAENRLALRVDMQGTVMRQSVSAVLSGRGVPRYEAQSGAMYFDADDAKIDQLKIAGRSVAGGDDTPRSRLTEAAGSAVQRLGESAMKAFLAARPVYRFKDDFKGIVLKAALVDVAIQQDTLVATFSLWNLTLAVATFALVLIAVLLVIYWLVRHPVWGLEIVADLADVCQ